MPVKKKIGNNFAGAPVHLGTTDRDQKRSPGSNRAQRSSTMRSFNLIRTAIVAASLIAGLGNIGAAFADTMPAPQAQLQLQPSNTSPYDSPDFVVPQNDING
jgi:hypothetical protein